MTQFFVVGSGPMTSLGAAVTRLAIATRSWTSSLSTIFPLRWTGRLWIKPIVRSRASALGAKSLPAGSLADTLSLMRDRLDQIEGSASLLYLSGDRQRVDLLLYDLERVVQSITTRRAEIEVPKSVLDNPVNQQLGRYHTHNARDIDDGVIDPARLGTGDSLGKVLRPGRWS